MAEAVGAIRVDLYANLAEWGTNLKKAEGQLQTFANKTKAIGNGFAKAGMGMSLALTAPLALFGRAALKASADAQDLQGVVNITFGDMADDVNAWAKTTGDAMGRSTQTMQSSAVAFAEFFEDFAPSEEATASLSKTFATLTEDFAAFRNVSSDQASGVLLKGLAGSARGLKALGIDISDTALKAKALELGFQGANGKLTEQQKVMARAAIIMQGLQKVQGEVNRSQGEGAEETTRARENFQELLVTVGDQLLPIFTQVLQMASGVLEGFNNLDDGTKQLIVTIGGIAAVAGPALFIFGGLIKGVGALALGFKGIVGIGSAVVGFFTRMLVARQVGNAIKAFGVNAEVAGTQTKNLTGKLLGAAGAFLALAPVAYSAGAAVVKFFRGDKSEAEVMKQAEELQAKFKGMGLNAEEARLAVKALFASYGQDKPISEQQAIDIGRTQAAANAARLKAEADAASAEAAAAAAAAQAEFEAALAAMGLTMPGTTDDTSDLADELQRIRDTVDPVGAALRQYNADLKLAAQAGVEAEDAQRAFGQALIDQLGGIDVVRKNLKDLPPIVAQIVKEYDALASAEKKRLRLGEARKQQRDEARADAQQARDDAARALDDIRSFGDALTDQFDPASKLVKEIKRIDDAFAAGAISADVMRRAKDAAFAASPQGQAALDMERKRGETIADIADAFTAATTGAMSFGDAMKQMLMEAFSTELIKPFFTNLIGSFFPTGHAGTGGILSGLGGMFMGGIGSLFGFGGTMDAGGNAYAGQAYKIGGGVTETFFPKTDGKIVRGHQMVGAQSGGGTQNFNFYGDDVGSYRASKRQIARQAQRGMQA